MDWHRVKDRWNQWWRYPQPGWLQRSLLGMHTDSFDIDFTARRLATESSARFVVDNLRCARNFLTDYDLHQWSAQQVDPDILAQGHVMEFGVATGRTLNHWCRLFPGNTVWGFDGFQGLPETWSWNFAQGHFRQRLPRVANNAELVVGWFDQTLESWLAQHPGPVALLHIDCDLYSSTAYVLQRLKPRMVPGTIIVFDEYLNFPGWEQDEHRAWQEFCRANAVQFEYLAFVSRHQQVAVRVTAVDL